jgi:CHAT domain-containing protein
MQNGISNDGGVIIYAITRQNVFAWLLRKDSVGFYNLGVNPAVLKSLVASSVRKVSSHKGFVDSRSDLCVLYDILIRPLESNLAGIRDIVVVPDSYIRLIPFAALYNTKRNAFLIEEHSIVIDPGVDCLLGKSVRKSTNLGTLLVSNPAFDRSRYLDLTSLSGSQLEAGVLSRVLRGKVEILSGESATRTAILSGLERSSSLLFSGHTVSSEEFPDRSALLVTPDPSDKFGLITIDDFQYMSLENVNLVVLASCRTSDRALDDSGVFFGFASILTARGVSDVITTLWPVEDLSSSSVIIDFYKQIGAGLTPREALRKAQINCIRQRKAPSSWASFVVSGSGAEAD